METEEAFCTRENQHPNALASEIQHLEEKGLKLVGKAVILASNALGLKPSSVA